MLFGITGMDEHDFYCKKSVLHFVTDTAKPLYSKAQGRAAQAWDRMDNNVYPTGVKKVVYTANHVPCVTPSGNAVKDLEWMKLREIRRFVGVHALACGAKTR